MTHRRYFLLCLALVACSTSHKRLEQILPEQAGDWRRQSVQPINQIPPVVAQMGVEEAVEATYSGASTTRVHVFRMKAETSAFELIQKWRQTDGLAIYKGPYFLIAQTPADDPGGKALLVSLQNAIK